MLNVKSRTIAVDPYWDADVVDAQLSDHVFQRAAAKGVRFTNVTFRFSTFDACYFRKCVFDSCDFTGCRFAGSNLHGSTFTGCTFDYASFERTLIDNDVLDTGCPAFENLKSRFARTLRTNYQSLGDSESVNKAILVELEATRIHLWKAWNSNESYYRKKYVGIRRAKAFVAWCRFWILESLWGNGERPLRVLRITLLLLFAIAIADTFAYRNPFLIIDYGRALVESPQVFLGTKQASFPGLVMAGIAVARLTIFGLFLSILVRRFARR